MELIDSYISSYPIVFGCCSRISLQNEIYAHNIGGIIIFVEYTNRRRAGAVLVAWLPAHVLCCCWWAEIEMAELVVSKGQQLIAGAGFGSGYW